MESKIKLLDSEKIVLVMERFKKNMPEPKSELEWSSPFTLLVAVVLSAQATDKSVNKVTRELFKVADTPEKILAMGEENLAQAIKSIGLYRSKAAHIILLCRRLIDEFGGVVPGTREELMSLSGVGRKTANVVLNVVWNKSVMPVDTHILRIAPKIGLGEGKTPELLEKSLVSRIPEEYMNHAHHWLILHGRYVCKARNPLCRDCVICDLCLHN